MAVELNLPTGKLQYGPYSPSRLETAICGWAFYKQYVDPQRVRKERFDGLAAARGSVVHEVFESMNVEMMAGRYAFDPNVLRGWVVKAINEYPAAFEDMEMVMNCVSMYANNPPQNLPEDAEIEQALALDMDLKECDYGSPDALIRGRADLLWFDDDLRVHILDYKTQPNIEEADTFQMGIYALVMARKFNLKEAYTSIYFARYGKYSKEHLWTEEALNNVEQILLARIESIENRTEWTATPHNGCQYCDYRSTCPIFKDNFEVDEETTQVKIIDPDLFQPHGDMHRASRLAKVLVQLEELTSLGKKSLKEFMTKYEIPSIASGNKAFMFKPSEDFDWTYINKNTKPSVVSVLGKHGVDATRYSVFNKRSFTPLFLMEDKAEMFQELKEHLPRKAKTTWTCGKI